MLKNIASLSCWPFYTLLKRRQTALNQSHRLHHSGSGCRLRNNGNNIIYKSRSSPTHPNVVRNIIAGVENGAPSEQQIARSESNRNPSILHPTASTPSEWRPALSVFYFVLMLDVHDFPTWDPPDFPLLFPLTKQFAVALFHLRIQIPANFFYTLGYPFETHFGRHFGNHWQKVNIADK